MGQNAKCLSAFTSALTKTGREQMQQTASYSISSSAMASSPDGMVRPNAFAVCKFMTNSNLVDCITGRSAGLKPLRILPA